MDRSATTPAVAGAPRLILRMEGLALLALATLGFSHTGASWWLYAVLFLAPDVSFAAYAAGPKPGALAYNALHTTVGPAALAGMGFLVKDTTLLDMTLLAIAAVWAAHIGFDRMLGYGLKYSSAFGDTHLGRIGRAGA
ncbi:MAG TPA: DUF4260 domain-containing protein [Microvirga sp.]|nr:DUF4260 domain-containing protein [Microvirga sp.]